MLMDISISVEKVEIDARGREIFPKWISRFLISPLSKHSHRFWRPGLSAPPKHSTNTCPNNDIRAVTTQPNTKRVQPTLQNQVWAECCKQNPGRISHLRRRVISLHGGAPGEGAGLPRRGHALRGRGRVQTARSRGRRGRRSRRRGRLAAVCVRQLVRCASCRPAATADSRREQRRSSSILPRLLLPVRKGRGTKVKEEGTFRRGAGANRRRVGH